MEQALAVQMEHITKYYGGIRAVDDACLEVKKGTIHALMEENGAGKSTLMKMLCGIVGIDTGTVKLNGEPVRIRSLIEAQEHRLAIVPQELALVDYFTVAENMFLGREQTVGGLVSKSRMYAEAAKQLKALRIDLDPRQLAGELSVSQQQMLVIARSLSLDAETIILDEPTARLGAHEIDAFLEYMKYLRSRGKTLILISHKLEEIFAVCDEVTVLRDGRVIARHAIENLTVDQLIREMVDRPSERLAIEKRGKVLEETILEVEHLSCKKMVRDVSFSLRKGEILGFYGLVGAAQAVVLPQRSQE